MRECDVRIVPFIVLALGLLTVGLGLAASRSVGRGATLGGCVIVSLALYLLFADTGGLAKYAALVAFAGLLVFAGVNAGPAAWRSARSELLLVCAAILGILVSTFWTDAPSPFRTAFVIAVGVLTAAFIIVTLVRFARMALTAPRGE
jgi:hypothetical protein